MNVRSRWQSAPIGVGAGFGFAVFGLIGAIAGLVRGLMTYPSTSWAAAIELAAPAVMVGSLFGAGVGAVVLVVRRN